MENCLCSQSKCDISLEMVESFPSGLKILSSSLQADYVSEILPNHILSLLHSDRTLLNCSTYQPLKILNTTNNANQDRACLMKQQKKLLRSWKHDRAKYSTKLQQLVSQFPECCWWR